MSRPKLVEVAAWAGSELDLQSEVADLEDDQDVLAVLAAWNGHRLSIAATDDRQAVWRGLTTLANRCDDYAEHDPHFEVRQHNRWARDGLTCAADRVLRLTTNLGGTQ